MAHVDDFDEFIDLKLKAATKVVNNLRKNNERDRLILYYINNLKDTLKHEKNKTQEYQQVFNLIGKFIPKDIDPRNVIYGSSK